MEMISGTENLLVPMACFLAEGHNGSSTHSFGYLALGHHREIILFSLLKSLLEDVEVLGLNFVMQLVRYDLVLCFLELKNSREV